MIFYNTFSKNHLDWFGKSILEIFFVYFIIFIGLLGLIIFVSYLQVFIEFVIRLVPKNSFLNY